MHRDVIDGMKTYVADGVEEVYVLPDPANPDGQGLNRTFLLDITDLGGDHPRKIRAVLDVIQMRDLISDATRLGVWEDPETGPAEGNGKTT